MDIDAELPPDLEWYKNQIAGHHPSVIRNGFRQIGLLKERGRNEIILKLAQDGIRGEREIALYVQIENLATIKNGADQEEENSKAAIIVDLQIDLKTKLMLTELYKFIPRYYGCRKIQLVNRGIPKEFLQLEDITHPFTKPCIMDIKIGRVTCKQFFKLC